MKLLFVLSHGLYLRHVSRLIADLDGRGHAVEVTFSAERSGDAELFGRLAAHWTRARLRPAPRRTGWWWPAADTLRVLRDFVHYLSPKLADAPRARMRAAKRVPSVVRAVAGTIGSTRAGRALLRKGLSLIEWSLPPDEGARAFLREAGPDLAVFSPLIDLDYAQLDLLKAARVARIPSAHLVASWDNLTFKGAIQIPADRTLVWNAAQKREAVELHGVSETRIDVTGAPLYDDWFEMRPAVGRAAFCERSGGLDPERPVLLYACSSPFIAGDELDFIVQWNDARRSHSNPQLARSNVIVRPHPQNLEPWDDFDPGRLPGCRVWPPATRTPIERGDRQSYFDSLWHADAVAGINTSVFIEAAILGRRTFTVRAPAFRQSQDGTRHFGHVVNGGVVSLADDMDGHFDQISRELTRDRSARRPLDPFVEDFVRGGDAAATATRRTVDALLSVPEARLPAARATPGARLIRFALLPLAALYLRPRYLAKLRMRRSRP